MQYNLNQTFNQSSWERIYVDYRFLRMEDVHNPEPQLHAATGRRVRIHGGGAKERHNRGDEIRATLVHHVISHGFTMEEAA